MFQCFSINSIYLSRPCGKRQYRKKYLENIRNSDQYAHQRENSIEKTAKDITYFTLSVVIFNLRVTCYSYDQNHIRN